MDSPLPRSTQETLEFPKAVPLAQESQPKNLLIIMQNKSPHSLSAPQSRGLPAAVLTKAKSTVNNLQHCLGTGEYDDSEVQIALAHAKRMVKCAQSKVSNLKQEENLQRKYEREKSAKEMQQKSEVKRRVHQKENDLKQKMATEEIQQVQKEKSRRQEIIRKRRMHRNEERSNINEADMKYLQNTMDYKHGGISTAAGAATVDLSYVGLQMSELQQMEAQTEAQMNAELNATADAGTVDTATCDSGSSAAAASFNGSVSSGSVL